MGLIAGHGRFAWALGALVLIGLLLFAVPLIAQESDATTKSGFLRFVEGQLSTPNRQISINGLEGVLSSDVRIGEITVSDKEGVWLKIVNAHLVWDQGALLGGRLLVKSLTADEIDYIRQPVPDSSSKLPSPEAQGLSIPEFPVAIVIEKLAVPKVTFGQEVFGLSSDLSVEGSLTLAGGALDAKLDMRRLDGSGGQFRLALDYTPTDQILAVDVHFEEPKNGVVANLLNIEGRPALALDISGQGPVSGFNSELSFTADSQVILKGSSRIAKTAEGFAVTSDLGGPLADILPSVYRPFFGDASRLQADVLIKENGGVTLRSLAVTGGEMHLAASGATSADGFLTRLDVKADIGGASGGPVILPVPGGQTSLSTAELVVAYGGGEHWRASLKLDGLTSAQWRAEKVSLSLGGAVSGLSDPKQRRMTFNGDGAVTGIISDNPRIAEAFGQRLDLGLAGQWDAEKGLQLAQLRVLGKALEANLKGKLAGLDFTGDLALKSADLAPFSGLAGRQLGGAVDLAGSGSVGLLSGAFDLNLTGDARNLALGIAGLDPLIEGRSRLAGRLARDKNGVRAENFSIVTPHTEVRANGSFSSQSADFTFSAKLDDLGRIADQARGALTISGQAKGAEGNIELTAEARLADGRLAGRPASNLVVGLKGRLIKSNFTGSLTGDGFVSGHRAALEAGLQYRDGLLALNDLKFAITGTQITGGLSQVKVSEADNAPVLWRGDLQVDAPDISLAAALALTSAQGAVNAQISLVPDGVIQRARMTGRVRALKYAGIDIGSGDITARIGDLFGVPQIAGTLDAKDLLVAGIAVQTLSLNAEQKNAATVFSGQGMLANGAVADVAGTLTPGGGGFALEVGRLSLSYAGERASLAGPMMVKSENGTITLSDTRLLVGGGSVEIGGLIGDVLDLSVSVKNVSLALVDAVRPDLGLAGTVSGSARITGSRKDPDASFSLRGSGLSMRMLAGFGATPFALDIAGRYRGGALVITRGRLDGQRGITADISGQMPLVGANGRLVVSANVPLGLAELMLAGRGTQFNGQLRVQAVVTGSLRRPQFSGNVSTRGAEVVDPFTRLRLTGISADGTLSGERIVINAISAEVATGGRVSGRGTIGLSAAQGYPVDLKLRLDKARYADGHFFVATASGDLTLTGGLLFNPKLAGTLNIEKAEIAIPDLGAQSSTLLKVKNIKAPIPVERTIERAKAALPAGKSGAGASVLQLDVTLVAPNQVFVRGRGLNAELGGRVRITGPATAVRPVGAFSLIRGRLDILNQRLTFTSGRVTLVGDLNPYIDFTAQTEVSGTRIYVTVSGPASNPDVRFTSAPALPQDEVLSLLVFKRALTELSPLQLAQLATAAATLAGGGDSSMLDSIRAATGLDNLDIVTDKQGNAAVSAGSYIQDNVYVGVQAGLGGRSKVTIDLNVTDNLKIKGSAASDGETGVGVYYEQDY